MWKDSESRWPATFWLRGCRIGIGAALLCMIGFFAGTYYAGLCEARPASSTRVGWIEKKTGVIPQAWGDLVGVTSQNLQTVLVFMDVKGTLRRVHWNPSGVINPVVYVLARQK